MDIDEKLARLSDRVQARGDELRSALQSVPEVSDLAKILKATFGCSGYRFDIGRRFEYHRDPEELSFDAPSYIPARYTPPHKGKGKIARMRERERSGA